MRLRLRAIVAAETEIGSARGAALQHAELEARLIASGQNLEKYAIRGASLVDAEVQDFKTC